MPRMRRQRRGRPRKLAPPRAALKLLDSLTQPVFIENRHFDVLASNSLMRAVDPRLFVGGNQLRDMFLDPAGQALYPEWACATECLVANLRQAVGIDVDDPRFIELTGELTLASARFRKLWARHEVRGQTGGVMRFDHPQVGELTLNRERMSVAGTDGLMLVVFHPDVDSIDADKLALLASVTTPAPVAAHEIRKHA